MTNCKDCRSHLPDLLLDNPNDDGAYTTGSTYFVDGGLIRNYHEQ